MTLQNLNKQILITFIVLVFIIILFGITNIDEIVQDSFYNFSTNQWILDRELQPYKFVFYDGIKKFLIFIVVILITVSLLFWKTKLIQEYKKGIFVVVLSSIFIPLIVGGLKKCTNMPCPKHLVTYGGEYPKTKVWETYPDSFQIEKKVKCWPAGHASGGFALLSLFFLFKSRKNKLLSLIFALGIGWSMGTYKMLIGDHFLSHTILTMIIAWLIILCIVTITEKFNRKNMKESNE